MKIDYEFIKAAAKEMNVRVEDLLALSPGNDPFYQTPGAEQAAEWFAEKWRECGFTSGVHCRRVHYQLVSRKSERPNGSIYENTENCWDWLCKASLAARYLGLIDSSDFVDRRNPGAEIFHRACGDPQPEADVWDGADWDEYRLPGVPQLPALPYGLPSLPSYEASPLPDIIEDPVLVELWAEKTTQNDILIPICEKHGVNLVTAAGEMSEIAVKLFMERVREAGKPARILYVSDFDPGGKSMPLAVSRKVEFHQRDEDNGGIYAELDIRVESIALTGEQVEAFNLPKIPVKSTDKRKSQFEEAHGEGACELDALEALHPGSLASIVENAILRYRDLGLSGRTHSAYADFESYLEYVTGGIHGVYAARRREITADYDALREEWQAIRAKFAELTEGFKAEIEQLTARADDIRESAKELHEDVADHCATHVDELDEYEPPEADLSDEPDGQLYDSRRDYWEQLRHYKAHKNGEQGRAANA